MGKIRLRHICLIFQKVFKKTDERLPLSDAESRARKGKQPNTPEEDGGCPKAKKNP